MRKMGFKKNTVVPIGLMLLLIAIGLYGQVLAQERDGNLKGQSQVDWIVGQMEATQAIYVQIQGMLDEAKKEKDILKITCLDDKLTQTFVNLRGIEDRTQALKLAVSGGDTPTANHQSAILKIYVSRIQSLKAEAESCLGEVDIVLGDTKTSLNVDEDIAEKDPSEEMLLDAMGVDQPPLASGFF
jgi:hypothetical protein